MEISKFSNLKKKLKKLVILNIVFILLGILSYSGVSYYQDLIENKRISIKSNILTTRKKVTDLKTQLNEIEAAKKFWEKSENFNSSHSGLQLNEAYSIIKYFEEKYNIINLQVHLSPPTDLGKEYSSSNFAIVSSTVSLAFGGMSDENVFQFVDAIINNFPGFKLVKSFKVNKQVEFSDTVLKQIRSGNKPSVVVAELLFEWRDFKDI